MLHTALTIPALPLVQRATVTVPSCLRTKHASPPKCTTAPLTRPYQHVAHQNGVEGPQTSATATWEESERTRQAPHGGHHRKEHTPSTRTDKREYTYKYVHTSAAPLANENTSQTHTPGHTHTPRLPCLPPPIVLGGYRKQQDTE